MNKTKIKFDNLVKMEYLLSEEQLAMITDIESDNDDTSDLSLFLTTNDTTVLNEYEYLNAGDFDVLDYGQYKVSFSCQDPISISTTPRPAKNDKRIFNLYSHVLAKNTIKVCSGYLYVYVHDSGYYERLDKAQSFVFLESCFDNDDRVSLSNKVIEEVYSKLLRSPELQVYPDEFNVDITEVNCLNGIVKIGGSSIKLLPHTPERLFSYCIQAKYILETETVSCPAFDQFCRTSLDDAADKRTLLLQMLGYTCSDSNNGKTGLFLKGQPNTGKSVVLELLTNLIGKQNVSNVDIHCLGARFNKAELFGKKANIQAEMKSDKLPDISTYKAITGSDRIMGEYKGKSPFYFMPRCKLVFAGNALPGTRELEATSAMRNRIVPLLFGKTIEREHQDAQLKEKLVAEIDSLFTLSMLELDRLHKQNYRFDLPTESVEFLEVYSSVLNSARSFMNDCCKLAPTEVMFCSDLIIEYNKYCQENGMDAFNKAEFYSILDNTAGLRRCRVRKDGQNKWGYRGLRVMDKMERNLEY